MVPLVHFELLPQPPPLPVGKGIAEIEKVGSPSQIDVAHQHSAKVADVAHVIARGAKRAEKFDRDHDRDKNLHGDRYREGEHPNAPIGEQYGVGQQYAVDGARCTDCGNHCLSEAVRIQRHFHGHVDDAGAYSAEEKVSIEAARTPSVFEIGAEHRQKQQIKQDMQNSRVQKKVSEELPDPESMQHRVRHKSEPLQPEFPSRVMKKQLGKFLQNKHTDARDTKRLDGSRKVAA